MAQENIMVASIECAEAGLTTGEWADTLRDVFGEYRAPTGISGVLIGKLDNENILRLRAKIQQLNEALGRNLKLLIGKPGLDGHSNGAEQIAVKAREVGMEVVYEGIRLTPEKIAESALQEGVHVVGLSILSGSHLSLVPEVIGCMKQRGLESIPIVLGGIIPKQDIPKMDLNIIRRVYAPKDFDLNKIMNEIIDVVAHANNIELSVTEGNIGDS
jgi:(2R)-ethylmalonyl-CoA mutase